RHTRCLSDWSSDVCSSDLSHDALPPSVKVIDQDLHHRVFGPSLFIIALENEGGWPNGENHDIALKNLLEAKGLIKGTAPREILRSEERRVGKEGRTSEWTV